MVTGCDVISDLHLFQEIMFSNHCCMFSKRLMLSFIDKVTTGTYCSELLIWKIALVVPVVITQTASKLAFRLEPMSADLDFLTNQVLLQI